MNIYLQIFFWLFVWMALIEWLNGPPDYRSGQSRVTP